MVFDFNNLSLLSEKFGDSFYILDIKKLDLNYAELLNAFTTRYKNFYIAYSYKTNYTPIVCKEINKLGGYAEVVSEMEYELAKKIGVLPERIILNGPLKSLSTVKELLFSGGMVNIDSIDELYEIDNLCLQGFKASIGIRCNFDVSDGTVSRFGIDVNSKEFETVLEYIKNSKNIKLSGLHCHIASRGLDVWKDKVTKMLELLKLYNFRNLDYVDFGGGLFGKMPDSLKCQFDSPIPSFDEYAETVASHFAEHFKLSQSPPKLFIEPGSALVGDVMKFVSKVVSIKTVRGKSIATLNGSMYNINPTLSKKNLPISVYHFDEENKKTYTDMDFGGYTCIESDYLLRGYAGKLGVGDFVVFNNVGSYSVVLKPPFILPNVPIITIDDEMENVQLVKSHETFNDIFGTYLFN